MRRPIGTIERRRRRNGRHPNKLQFHVRIKLAIRGDEGAGAASRKAPININAGAQHRRFAVTINLNHDYSGCDLVFPEFGSRTYRAPHGGAVVFSCGALHQVTPITRG
ncbi:MAG TPA: hypothetical protein VMJ52_10040 [Xanthobacteraceae bacterium]|nr:hypothetical protein [Xanthobacteraceae bacterium]